MDPKIYRIFKIITPIIAIAEFIIIIIHFSYGGLSTCENKELMNKLSNSRDPNDPIDKYYDVLCYYDSGLGRLLGYIFLIIFNVLSLIFSFVGVILAFIILSKSKHCVILTLLIFYFISAIVAFIDFMLAVCKPTSLSGYSYLNSDVVSSIEWTLERVKEKKVKLIVITIFFLLTSVGGIVITIKILKASDNEENARPNNVYQGLQYQYNPQQNLVNNNINYNINNNNNYNSPAPVVQENMYQQTNS